MEPLNDEQLPAIFVQLADTLRSDYDVVDTMDFLVQATADFTRATEAGVLLRNSEGQLRVVASSSERSADLEEAQIGASAGPCFEAIKTGVVVEISNIASEATRWPDFARSAREEGFHAAHAIPLRLRNEVIGGLNLFFDRPGPLGERETLLASALAQIATISFLQHRALQHHAAVTEQLQNALDSRVVIEQAKGMIAQERGILIGDAFAVLREHARRNRARLRDTAELVVRRDLVL